MRRAADALSVGPKHTLDLAREVLGLSGHDGAAAAAVFHLLGSDPRFEVDASGVWCLDGTVAPLGVPLADVPFAVVDVETTGRGSWLGHRMIEIAIVEVRGGEVIDQYETLLNPGQRLPAEIMALTGIDDAMVEEAPYFEHVADEVADRLRGRVFVAHNATFDWSFVSAELVAARGEVPDLTRLCTVRMSRRLVPHLRHRNLDVLAHHFSVPIHARHRAGGDALATARILIRLLDEAAGRGIEDVATLVWYLRSRRQKKHFDPKQYSLELPGYEARSKRRR